MIGQGFNKIANLYDERYLSYLETLNLFKALSQLADSHVDDEGKG